nr:unnamed protein product [Callosobruchus analis]
MLFKYYIEINATDKEVCKNEFLAVHGLHQSKKRVYDVYRQISAGKSTPKCESSQTHIVAREDTKTEKMKYQKREKDLSMSIFEQYLNIAATTVGKLIPIEFT